MTAYNDWYVDKPMNNEHDKRGCSEVHRTETSENWK